ncbi:hypothetical protein JKP88DRAFT_323483 [Tribonema minus]|uniref:Transmembrane protein n=1 Tax=Tribonema minus TaxID=303371 RepID=A0A835YT15_9STRA|nr:hypothetical protein JKP88DRAFT_323483 [Tribonema minus]
MAEVNRLWNNYWGEGVQRAGKVAESFSVAFLGVWACYFTSFFLGVAITSVIGVVFVFYWLLGPNLLNYRKNWEFRGKLAPSPKEPGTRAALFSASIANVVEEVNPITGKAANLRLEVADEEGRALMLRVPAVREAARVEAGMGIEVLLISDEPGGGFEDILGVSDAYIPAIDLWVGDYPHLNKLALRRLLNERYRRSAPAREAAAVTRRAEEEAAEDNWSDDDNYWSDSSSSDFEDYYEPMPPPPPPVRQKTSTESRSSSSSSSSSSSGGASRRFNVDRARRYSYEEEEFPVAGASFWRQSKDLAAGMSAGGHQSQEPQGTLLQRFRSHIPEILRLQFHWKFYLMYLATLPPAAAKFLGNCFGGYQPNAVAAWWWEEPGQGKGPMAGIFIFMYAMVMALSLLPVARMIGAKREGGGAQAALLWICGLGVGALVVCVAVASVVQRVTQTTDPAAQSTRGAHYYPSGFWQQQAQVVAIVVSVGCGVATLAVCALSMACAARRAAAAEVTLRGRSASGAWEGVPVMLVLAAYSVAQCAVSTSMDFDDQQFFLYTALCAFGMELTNTVSWEAGGFAVDVAPRTLACQVAVTAAARRTCEIRVAATEATWGNLKFTGRFVGIVAQLYLGLSVAAGLGAGGVSACVYAVIAVAAACGGAVAFVQAWAGMVYRRRGRASCTAGREKAQMIGI